MGNNCVRADILGWLESVRWPYDGWGRWKYNAHMVRPYGLISSALAIKILHHFGALGAVAPAPRQEAIAFLRAAQDPADGNFKDPLVTEADRVEKWHHSWEDIWGQMSVAADALALLGATPVRPLPRAAFVDLATANACDWVLGLEWGNPWHVGERFFRAVGAYLGARPELAPGRTDTVLEAAFGALEAEIIDPATGMPTRRGCANPAVAMAGLFKVMFAYLDAGRPVPHVPAAVGAVLRLHRDSGEFGAGGDMCINWDALWVLRELDLQARHPQRRADIAAAGNRLVDALLRGYRQADGAFAFTGASCLPVHHSVRLSDRYPESDMLGTFVCLQCLHYADEWNGAMAAPARASHVGIRDHAACP